MRTSLLALLVLAGLLPLTGCRRDAEAPPRKLVGVSVLTLTNPFFKEIGDVFTAEMARHGYEALVVSGDEDQARQKAQVEDFLAKGVAAIVLCPCNSQTAGEAIRLANQQGVPVFTADIACLDRSARVVTHVATDNYAGGKQAGQAVIEALGPAGGKVLVLDYASVESCQLRVKGFHEVIDGYNRDRGPKGAIEIVAELPGGGNKEQAAKTTADALVRFPDLAGIFAINDPSALGAYSALGSRAGQVKIIGFDGQLEGKQAIKEGKIYADPVQYPDKIGQETAHVILQYFQGEQPRSEILIPPGLYRKADAERDGSLK